MTISQQASAPGYRRPDPVPPKERSNAVARWFSRAAAALRRGFDRLSGFDHAPAGPGASAERLTKGRWFLSPLLVAGGLAALAAGAAVWGTSALNHACGTTTSFSIRLQVTFSASTFAELLSVLSPGCRALVVKSLGRDVLSCLTYPFALAALFIWTERWRRFERRPDADDLRADMPLPLRNDVVVVASFIAGALDLAIENLATWRAITAIRFDPIAIPANAEWWVRVASVAAALKWTILFGVACALVAEAFSGPRGVVLRRLRFGAIAVVLGALPLLSAPGQDILQRLAEGQHRLAQTTFGVLAVAFAATAVWYCGRKLMQLELDAAQPMPNDDSRVHLARDRQWRGSPWYAYFGEHLPRIMGIAVLGIAGLGFATAGLALRTFWIVVGVSAAVVLALELYERTRNPRPERPTDDWRKMAAGRARNRRGLAAAIGALLGAGMLVPFGTGSVGVLDEATRERVYLCAAAWGCLAAGWALYFWVYHRRQFGATERLSAIGGIDARAIPRDVKLKSWTAALVSAGLLLALAASPVLLGRRLGPLTLLAIFAANTVFLGSVMVWIHVRYHLPIVRLGLGLAVVFGLWNENHDVRTIASENSALMANRPGLEQQFDRWLARRRADGATSVPVVLVAAAGGGLRASYWTAAALAAAQDRDSTFVRHVFAMSGVSGGSLGLAMFTALARDAAGRADTLPCAREQPDTAVRARTTGAYTRCIRRFMGEDFLSPVLSMMVAPDLLQRFLPIPFQRFDRSRGLEDAWVASYRAATGRNTFREGVLELTPDSATQVNLPSLFLNSTHVETGKRYIAASVRTSPAIPDQRDVLALIGTDLPLASAVHNSARFTYVSPAGHLALHDGREYGRVVDGGYFENSGLATLGGIWRALAARASGDAAVHPVVLYLCNDPLPCVAETNGDTTTTTASTYANETLSPLRAIMKTRGARGSLARAEIMKLPGVTYLQLNVCDNLTTGGAATGADSSTRALGRERAVSPPLSWLLSGLVRDWMDSSLTAGPAPNGTSCRANNARALERLHEMLQPGTTSPSAEPGPRTASLGSTAVAPASARRED